MTQPGAVATGWHYPPDSSGGHATGECDERGCFGDSPAQASRAKRGSRPGPPRPEPIASRRSSSRESAERIERAPDPSLADFSRGHTAHEVPADPKRGVAPRRDRKSRRLHMFCGGVSLCGKAKQRPIAGLEVDCGTCLRIGRALVERWIEEQKER